MGGAVEDRSELCMVIVEAKGLAQLLPHWKISPAKRVVTSS